MEIRTKKERSLLEAIELVKATGGKDNTAQIVREVYEQIMKIRETSPPDQTS